MDKASEMLAKELRYALDAEAVAKGWAGAFKLLLDMAIADADRKHLVVQAIQARMKMIYTGSLGD